MSVTDSHVVITGGGTGVGAACAHRFHAAGARVTIIGRREAPLVEQNLPYQLGDVTDPDQINAAFDKARNEQGPITAILANAGAAPSKPFSKMTARDFTDALDVNLSGVFNCFQAALPDMRENGGRMIAIASTAGLKGYPYVAGYCAAKHGVIGLVRALAVELAGQNITVNAICPGFVKTPLLEHSIETIMNKTGLDRETAEARLKRGNPQGRFIETDEIAETALWLCSNAARSVNGHAMVLSGGEI